MFDEWKKFLSRGNFIDLATGMVIGAAFSKIVSSFTADILSNLFISLTGESYSSLAAAKEAGAPVIAYGAFLNVCLDFVIVATAIFILIKQINRFMPAPPPPAPDPRKCPYCKETVADDATKCPHCASDISASVVSK